MRKYVLVVAVFAAAIGCVIILQGGSVLSIRRPGGGFKAAEPDLANLGGGGNYTVLSWDSPDGNDSQVTAANTSGFDLLAASSSELEEVVSIFDRKLAFASGTTFSPVYLNGSSGTGPWSGSAPSWAIRSVSTGKIYPLSGYTLSTAPPQVVGIPPGGTVTVPVGEVNKGNGALWLCFETDTEHGTVSFLIMPSRARR
jgi:hypothetical protein